MTIRSHDIRKKNFLLSFIYKKYEIFSMENVKIGIIYLIVVTYTNTNKNELFFFDC
jgi:hypothetical protein